MNAKPPAAEKARPFRLVKYFTFTSLIAIFVGTLVLSLINSQWVKTMQLRKSEEYAQLLTANLNHQVFLQFVLPVALKHGKIQTRNPDQFERLDQVVRSTLHSFNVEMVNIHDMNDTISYSFDESLVGKKNLGGDGYRQAATGKSNSRLEQKGSWLELLLGFPKDSRIITFAPLHAEKPLSPESGPILGVLEIVQDLSDDYEAIFRVQVFVIITSTVFMGALFLVLIFVVKRGEGIIEGRAAERLRLEEQLQRTEHLSRLGEMVAGVSHEIRNPLGIIRSSAELLKKRLPENPIADIIVEESSRMDNIINDFLNFARPKNPVIQACRIEEIVARAVNLLESTGETAAYPVTTRFESHLPAISADAEMLTQAFLNILINATQSMPDGGPVDVSVTEAVPGKALRLVFDDRGEGLPPERAHKIWDPFFTTKDKGTGLGLGIVKNIVESHGGSVGIETRPQGGARVSVRLPVGPPAADAA